MAAEGVIAVTWINLAPLGAVAVAAAIEQASVGGGLERLTQELPLVAALMGGLWLLFKAYQSLVERVLAALDHNTAAFTENARSTSANAEVTRELRQTIEAMARRLDGLDRRVSTIEHDEEQHHRRGS